MKYSCPQWIIDCRHNLCHSSVNQPTLEELKTASMIGLDWLRQYFWLKLVDNYDKRSKLIRNYSEVIENYLNNKSNNNNNNSKAKTKTKSKNDIIRGLREFPNDFLSVLVERLITPISNETKTEGSDNQQIPKVSLRKYSKIFAIVMNHKSISIVLFLLVRHFDSIDQSRRHLAISWFQTIIEAIDSKEKISKFKRIFKSVAFKDIMPRIEWIRLLHSLVRRTNVNTPALIQLIAPIVSDVIPKHKIEMLVNLAKEFSRQSLTDETDDNVDTDYVPKTIEDVVRASHQMNDSSLNMSGECLKFFPNVEIWEILGK